MKKDGLNWVAFGNDLRVSVNTDVDAHVTEATDNPSKKWKLIFEKFEEDNIVDFTPALYMNTLEDAFDKVFAYYLLEYDYDCINQEIKKYYEALNSDIAP